MIEVVNLLESENLFSRRQARQLEPLIANAFASSSVICLDFVGARMMTPSFFDEVLWIIEGENPHRRGFKVYLDNAPEPLGSKFSRVAAGHELAIDHGGGVRWVLTGRGVAVGHPDA